MHKLLQVCKQVVIYLFNFAKLHATFNSTDLQQHIICVPLAVCTQQFSPITVAPLTILIPYNEHKSNNNTIFDMTDYETCYKTNI